jgi:hypothetical protein
MNNHGIHHNTLRLVDSANTQHYALLKHCIVSETHVDLILYFRSAQYSIGMKCEWGEGWGLDINMRSQEQSLSTPK